MKVLLRPYGNDPSSDKYKDCISIKEIEFHNDDFWNLDVTLANVILEAMVEFKNRDCAKRDSKYNAKYSSALKAFKHIIEGERVCYDKNIQLEVKKGLSNFADIFTSLWT
jgi:hypothetical protein